MIKWHQSSMELRLVQLCLLLSACCFSSGLSCRWIKHKFRHHHGVSLDLIRKMGEEIHNDHEDINPIPYGLINNHRKAEREIQIMFIIQALEEITDLFEDAVVPWADKKLDDFLNNMHQEIKGLHTCGAYEIKRNKKLHLYFKRLRHMTELNTERDHSWEMVRNRITSFMNQLEFFSLPSHD